MERLSFSTSNIDGLAGCTKLPAETLRNDEKEGKGFSVVVVVCFVWLVVVCLF